MKLVKVFVSEVMLEEKPNCTKLVAVVGSLSWEALTPRGKGSWPVCEHFACLKRKPRPEDNPACPKRKLRPSAHATNFTDASKDTAVHEFPEKEENWNQALNHRYHGQPPEPGQLPGCPCGKEWVRPENAEILY
jgi:hypothetical protein